MQHEYADDLVRTDPYKPWAYWLAGVYSHQSGRACGPRRVRQRAGLADVRILQTELEQVRFDAVQHEQHRTPQTRNPRVLDPDGTAVAVPFQCLYAADTVRRLADERKDA